MNSLSAFYLCISSSRPPILELIRECIRKGNITLEWWYKVNENEVDLVANMKTHETKTNENYSRTETISNLKQSLTKLCSLYIFQHVTQESRKYFMIRIFRAEPSPTTNFDRIEKHTARNAFARGVGELSVRPTCRIKAKHKFKSIKAKILRKSNPVLLAYMHKMKNK